MKAEGCQLKANDVEKIDLSLFDESVLREHQMKVLFGSGLYACFRGSQEHAMFSTSQLEFGTYSQDFQTVELRGTRYVSISSILADKTHSLSITNSYVRDMENQLRFPINPADPACFGASLERLYLKRGPGQLRLYCKEASPSYKKKMALEGYPDAQMYPTKPLGRSAIGKLFSEGRVKLKLPDTFRPHSLRGACITKLVNDPSVSLAETMAVARHTSVSASKTYQRVDGISEGNRLRALGLLKTAVPAAVAAVVVPPPVPDPVPTTEATVPTNVSTVPTAAVAAVQDVPTKSPSPGKRKSLIVEVDEYGNPLDDDESYLCPTSEEPPGVPPYTQVGIEELKGDIAELKGLMRPQKVQKLSANQKAIQELRGVVKNLKSQLQNRENDILYYRSMDHDHDVRVDKLRGELRDIRKENIKLRMENKEFQRYIFGRDKF